jgi:glutamyl-tRNA synthetase
MIRVRIAPSPTGNLHLGNARTAIFNWLYAKNNAGVFIVRIDDTDLERSTKEFENDILDNLRWLGLEWDEGVGVGGPHGSYRQSDRFDRYKHVADELIKNDFAYKEDDAVKFRVENKGSISFNDLVRGEMTFNNEDIEDFVIMRSNGSPTYHLASTVDDIDYKITHVARGEDILSSTPKHIMITKALDQDLPYYCHLPLIFGPDGKRLSKRHGATSVKEFISRGFLSDALFNYMCLLGWSPEKDTEVFNHEYAISKFDLKNVLRSAAIFDEKKLKWMNGLYIRKLDYEIFYAICIDEISKHLDRKLFNTEIDSLKLIMPSIQERIENKNDIFKQVSFLLDEPFNINLQDWESLDVSKIKKYLFAVKDSIMQIEKLEVEKLELQMRELLIKFDLKPREGFQAVRIAITGSKVSPPLFESMVALGRAGCLARLEESI